MELKPGLRLWKQFILLSNSADLPRPGEVTEVDNDGFRQSNLRLGVITGEVVEAVHQGRSENIGQLLPMHRTHALQQTVAHVNVCIVRYSLPD